MKVAPFEYFAARTLEEAVDLLAQWAPEDGRIIAGGQSLVPAMAFRMAQPPALIDINRIGLPDQPQRKDTHLVIGCRVRHAAFETISGSDPLPSLLRDVVRHIAHAPIRNRGTFCGSLAYADPASEWCLVAATLGARMEAVSDHGTRMIDADDYFEDAMTTALAPEELLVRAHLPILPEGTRFGFQEFSRRPGDYAMAMALVTYSLPEGRMRNLRIGLGAVEGRPRRIKAAEQAGENERPEAGLFHHLAQIAASEVEALEDLNASSDYRCELAQAAVERAFARAMA